MSNVQIEINGHKYGIGCEDGQEEHLLRLARHFDGHVNNLVQSVGQIGDQRLFLMAALLIADESHELRTKLDATEAELARLRDVRVGLERENLKMGELEKSVGDATQVALKIEEEAANTVSEAAKFFDAASARIEALSNKLDAGA